MPIHVLNKKTYSPATHPVIIDPTRVVYVGRPSILGNPFSSKHSKYSIWTPNDNPMPEIPCPIEVDASCDTPEEAVEKFRDYLKWSMELWKKNEQGGTILFGENGKMMGNYGAFHVFGLVWKRVLQLAQMVKEEPDKNWGLMCWCAPGACHADVIKKAIEWVVAKS